MATRDLKKAAAIWRRQGFRALWKRVRAADPAAKRQQLHAYRSWIRLNERDKNRNDPPIDVHFKEDARISFLCPVYRPKLRYLDELLSSLHAQTYHNWEICFADGGSSPVVRRQLKRFAKDDPRVKVAFLEQNRGIAANTAAAYVLATGDVIGFVDHDDMLAPSACFEIVRALQNHGADFVYTDEDKFDESGRFDPHFKPAWSPDTLRSYNYITHLMAMKRALYERCGGIREGFDGSQDHDLALRATAAAEAIHHIPKILYHWRSHANSVAGDGLSKPYAFEAGRKAVESIVLASPDGVIVEDGSFPASYRARYAVSPDLLVSIVIPNRDKAELLRACLASIHATAGDTRFEVIVVENGSKESETFALYEQIKRDRNATLLSVDGPFNYSAANNLGAKSAKGDAFLFLNNDILALETGWLQALLEQAVRPTVGAVGAKLLYEDGTIQHAGVVVGLGGWADHVCAGAPEDGQGLMNGNHWLNVVRNVSAVTGACMMIARDKFEDVLGFSEDFQICGSDVDICLRLLAKGYHNVYTPFARLTHRESATRGQTEIPENDFLRSAESYRNMWENGDPYFSRHWDTSSKWPRIRTDKPKSPQGGAMH